MSVKPCSSNSEHSHSADSTSASAVARPYLASSRLSREPAFTPILIGTWASAAARAISPTLSSNALMLPGLTRTAPHPASIAANTYLGWKWISAITGICDLRAICGKASASSCDGTATRTIWRPAAVSSAICCRVAFTSAVSVVVIDCTETGAPPPTGTACAPLPTMIWRDFRRGASGSGGSCGSPRSTVMYVNASLDQMDRVDDIGHDQEQAESDQHREDPDTHRDQFLHVYQAGVGPAAQPGQPGPDPLVDDHGQVPAVHRQQRQQVEDSDEDIQRDDDGQDERDLRLPADLGRDDLACGVTGADHAADLARGGLRPVLREQVRQRRGQLGDSRHRFGDDLAERRAGIGHRPQRVDPLEDRVIADAEIGAAAARDRDRDDVKGLLPAIALHDDRGRVAGRLGADGRPELRPVAHPGPADRDDLVTGLEPGQLRGRAAQAA